ncbi:MAG TPA: histidine--tRNA ligase [Anaerolineales bacterium]|nr:histidine--tRNA ligase [Anaerolineales bacterium]
MKKTIPPVKGTTDFYPELMAIRTWLYTKIRAVSEAFGYQEYEGPMLETLELYAAKSGEELVNEQSFVFPDRGGDMIALRPELTPTLARMIAQRQNELAFPARWWSFGPMWRYERPQKGRTREFFQWNIDLIGLDTPQADAEMAAIGAGFLKAVGLSPGAATIRVNSRRLMEAELAKIGVPQGMLPKVFQLIDKLARMKVSEWDAQGLALGLSDQQLGQVRTLLEDENLWKQSDELVQFFGAAQDLGILEYLRFSASTIRGLTYYTGIIFECFDERGSFRSVFAGGRYDNLVADVGGDPLPGVGFAMGDKVIQVLLEQEGLLPDFSRMAQIDVLVTTFSDETMPDSLRLAAGLRDSGLRVAAYPAVVKLGKQLKYASSLGVRAVVILGPDELEQGLATVRDMRDRSQTNLPIGELATALKRFLDQEPPS